MSCLTLGLADGLIISIIISFMWMLRRNSKPTWSLKIFSEDDLYSSPNEKKSGEKKLSNNLEISLKDNDDLNIPKTKKGSYLFDVLQIEKPNVGRNMSYAPKANPKILELKKMTSNPEAIINEEEKNIENLRKENIPYQDKPLSVYDLCLCHNYTSCKKKCHILVFQLFGHLSYVNANMMKQQAEFLRFLTPDFIIKGLIYECDNLRTIDYSSLSNVKEIIKEMNFDPKIHIRFSQLPTKLRNEMSKVQIDDAQLKDSDKETMGVLYQMFNDIVTESKFPKANF